MKKLTFFCVLSFFIATTDGQNKEDTNGNLIGLLNKSDFLQGNHKRWFTTHYNEYEPEKKIINKIKKHLDGVSVKSFIGTWCHDSQRELPSFYKIMELADFDFEYNYEMIGITRGKKTPDNLQQGFHINYTPTFIFYKDGVEIGRYVERARQNFERDMLRILRGKSYKHVYQN